MTIYNICEQLGCDYESLVSAVIDVLEVTGYAIYTIDIIDEMDKLHDE